MVYLSVKLHEILDRYLNQSCIRGTKSRHGVGMDRSVQTSTVVRKGVLREDEEGVFRIGRESWVNFMLEE